MEINSCSLWIYDGCLEKNPAIASKTRTVTWLETFQTAVVVTVITHISQGHCPLQLAQGLVLLTKSPEWFWEFPGHPSQGLNLHCSLGDLLALRRPRCSSFPSIAAPAPLLCTCTRLLSVLLLQGARGSPQGAQPLTKPVLGATPLSHGSAILVHLSPPGAKTY